MAATPKLRIKNLRDLIRGSGHELDMCLVYNEETESLLVIPTSAANPRDIIITTRTIYSLLGEEQAWEMSTPLVFTDAQLEQVLNQIIGPSPF